MLQTLMVSEASFEKSGACLSWDVFALWLMACLGVALFPGFSLFRLPGAFVPRFHLASACLILVALGLLSCRPEAGQPAELPIGLITTEFEGRGSDNFFMAEKLFERVNASGGLEIGSQVYRLALRHQGSGSTPEEALQSAQRLFNQHRIVALVGPNVSSFALPVAGLAERIEVPMIAPSATLPEVTAGKRFVFRVAPDDDQLARLMARFVQVEIPTAEVAVLFEVTNDYSRRFAAAFQQEMEAGGAHVFLSDYAQGETDFRSLLQDLQSHSPEALLLPNYSPDVQLQMEQLHELDWPVQVLGTDAWLVGEKYDSVLYDGTLIARLAYLSAPESEMQAELLEILEGLGLWADDSVILTYDAFRLLFDALQRCACIDGPSVRDALAATQTFRGAGGEVSFAPGGDIPGRLVMIRVTEGRPLPYRVLTEETAASE